MKTLLVVLAITVLLIFLTFKPQKQYYSGTTIHLAGDSTMATQLESRRPMTGWGEQLTLMLCDDIRVIDHAKNGRSSKSFLSEGLWKNLKAQLQLGDIVMIQFGHNDQKSTESQHGTDPWQDYKENLKRFVSDARALGADPILLTSIVRRVFDSQDNLEQTLGDYPAVTRVVASELEAPLIDLNVATHNLVESLGSTLSKQFYLHLAPNTNKHYGKGIQDDTHLSKKGAFEIASIVAAELEEVFPGLTCH